MQQFFFFEVFAGAEKADSCFAIFLDLHLGHSNFVDALTISSKLDSHFRHLYSNMGIEVLVVKYNYFFATSEASGSKLIIPVKYPFPKGLIRFLT